MPTGVYKRTQKHIDAMYGRRVPKGKEHGNWKGIKASYTAFHHWLAESFGKAKKCQNPKCKYPRKNRASQITYSPARFEYALIKGKEHDHKRENYITLCASCHRKYDMNLLFI